MSPPHGRHAAAPRVGTGDDTGPTYCCGAIYEDGETVCASCGEALEKLRQFARRVRA